VDEVGRRRTAGPTVRRRLIEGWQHDQATDGGDAVYGMFADGTVVGGCGLHRRRGPDVLEIGYWVHADHVRQGLATEAARLLTAAAFAVPGIVRVEIHHDRANLASRAVPARLGFTYVGEVPDQVDAPAEEGIDCIWARTEPLPSS
jgi:RimJ/RimL family protein N-acetyltransferase